MAKPAAKSIDEAVVRKRWGLPNWRDAVAYPFGKATTPSCQWRWQWLRRRKDYRTEWEARKQQVIVEDGVVMAPDPGFSTVTRLLFGTPTLISPAQALTDDQAAILVPPQIGRAVFGMRWISEEVGKEFERDGIALLAFDLRRPIGDQIAAAKEHLIDEQKRRGMKPGRAPAGKDNWVRYLQILDARDCGATWAEITSEFWDDESQSDESYYDTKSKEWHRTAAALRDKAPA